MPGPLRRHVQVNVQHAGQGMLIYCERAHRAFCLNPVCSAVWRLSNGLRTVQEIAQAATEEIGATISSQAVVRALAELERDGLLETQRSRAAQGIPGGGWIERMGALFGARATA